MVTVFVDTSAWHALRDRSDGRHGQARRLLERLVTAEATLHTTDLVVAEAAALMRRRVNPSAAWAEVEWITSNPTVTISFVNADLWPQALERFREARGRLSLVDCASFATMEALGLRQAFAFDQDFSEAGFEVESL